VFEDELKQLLREFSTACGARWVAIGPPSAAPLPDDPAETDRQHAPLGRGAVLAAEWDQAPPARAAASRAEALERAARAVRACARRWGVDELPELQVPPTTEAADERVLERIRAFLVALANTHAADNAIVLLKGQVVAAARPVEPLHAERLPFVIRQVDAAAARRSGSSHGEIAGEDVLAVSFWFGAHLAVFFGGPYATDFVRHRVRLVARELSQLLPLLDDPPRPPARLAPLPE
jgi:hypothetical protein